MRILFLNLPSTIPVVRRYMCSSFPPKLLFPPHELLSLTGVAKELGHHVAFTDASAERIDMLEVFEIIRKEKPKLIISILSFELFDKDVDMIREIKEMFPNIIYGIFGHYPTHFAKESIALSKADFVMRGEPDNILKQLLNNWKNDLPENIIGTFVNKSQTLYDNGEDKRIPNPNELPIPPYNMLKNKYYGEPLMPQPFGLIQSARGCPYQCNYCVHSFGTKLTMLTPENVIEHILFLKKVHNIKSLRFIDDTFTAIPSRVIDICKLIIDKEIDISWTCLSRADTLNEEMLFWMKKAGCVRINVGIESGSQKILDYLNKKINIDNCISNLQYAKKIGIEVMGFFLTGIPGETDEDILESINFAKQTCDYILVDTLKVYPGTPLFDKLREQVTFTLYPYQNYFSDEKRNKMAAARRSYFYRKFYLSQSFVLQIPFKILPHLSQLKVMVKYVMKRATTDYAY